MPSITPFLWFDGDLAEPIAFYTSIFSSPATPNVHLTTEDGPIVTATIELCGQKLMLLNGGPAHAGFTESISLFVSVDTPWRDRRSLGAVDRRRWGAWTMWVAEGPLRDVVADRAQRSRFAARLL
jgi:hypothetical protein